MDFLNKVDDIRQQQLQSEDAVRAGQEGESTGSRSSKALNENSTKSLTESPHQLKPPFRIVQLGEPRSGSTFQLELLRAIAYLKSPRNVHIPTKYVYDLSAAGSPIVGFDFNSNASIVFKTHSAVPILETLHHQGNLSVFGSGNRAPYAHYIQHRDNLVNCSLCEVDNYQPFFGLTDDEMETLKHHMSLFEKLRKCCGMQISKYEMLRLHGCNVSEFVNEPDYPRCELENLTQVELQFRASPIPSFESLSAKFNWGKPGDCASFEKIVRSGRDFNNEPFDGCEKSAKKIRLSLVEN